MTEYGVKLHARTTAGLDAAQVPASIERVLTAFNGENKWAMFVFHLPPGVATFNEYIDSTVDSRGGWPHEYLQAAGSADAMTVDVTRREPDGKIHQYVLGREAVSGEPSVALTFRNGEITTHVHSSEVFTAADAAPVFVRYLLENHFPAEFHLRVIAVLE
jgi:hypothetical protein